jgi:hypothetical protein
MDSSAKSITETNVLIHVKNKCDNSDKVKPLGNVRYKTGAYDDPDWTEGETVVIRLD